jgi:UDP-N-acetylglucosamine 4,6-dehydratase
MEAIKTNILGSSNVIDAALDAGVKKVLALSTDKAVNPINLYGATKLAAEKLFVQSNAYAGGSATRFSCVRYGNVVGSRGSVVPVFLKQRATGTVTITDDRMTRFWISLEQGVRFVIRCVEQMEGGEVFVPKIPSMKVIDLARAVAPDAQINIVGIRPGEKLHEVLISEDEARTTLELDDMYVVQPELAFWAQQGGLHKWERVGRKLPAGFRYISNTNEDWLTVDKIVDITGPIEEQYLKGALE